MNIFAEIRNWIVDNWCDDINDMVDAVMDEFDVDGEFALNLILEYI